MANFSTKSLNFGFGLLLMVTSTVSFISWNCITEKNYNYITQVWVSTNYPATKQPLTLSFDPYREKLPIHPCYYINVKGIEKSGTTWFEHTLNTIVDSLSVNGSIFSNSINVSVGSWNKHSLMRNMINTAGNSIENNNICYFVILRDPRDQMLSNIYWKESKGHYSKHLQLSQEIVNSEQNIHIDGVHSIVQLNNWWNFWNWSEYNSNSSVFTVFYQDLLNMNMDTKCSLIGDIISFIVFRNTNISYSEIGANIIHQACNTVKKMNMLYSTNMSGATKYRQGKHCAFRNEYTCTTIVFLNQQMIKVLDTSLLTRFNRTCPLLLTSHDCETNNLLNQYVNN